jgi:hypothetical protein
MNATAHIPVVVAGISAILGSAVINGKVRRLQHRFKDNGAISPEHTITLHGKIIFMP